MVEPHKTVDISLTKRITDQVYHFNIKPLRAKTLTYLQQIRTPLIILLHKMARPLRLYESQIQVCRVNILPLTACSQNSQEMIISLSPVEFSNKHFPLKSQ